MQLFQLQGHLGVSVNGVTEAAKRVAAKAANGAPAVRKVVKRFYCSQGCNVLLKDGRAAKAKKRKESGSSAAAEGVGGPGSPGEFCVDGAGIQEICGLMRLFPYKVSAA